MKRFCDPTEIPLPEDAFELHKKLIPVMQRSDFEHYEGGFSMKKQKYWTVMKKPDMNQSFLWTDATKETHDFIGYPTVTRYTYHKTGYYGFFKPSLDEIIQCAADVIRNADYVYVTSEPCNDYGEDATNVNEFYCRVLDLHQGKVTLWPVCIVPPN